MLSKILLILICYNLIGISIFIYRNISKQYRRVLYILVLKEIKNYNGIKLLRSKLGKIKFYYFIKMLELILHLIIWPSFL